jgi:hypothetical protein
MRKKFFLGWENIKWTIREIRDIYSDGDSYFSKKRIESGISFLIGQFGMVFFLYKNYEQMTTSDLAIWAGIEFAIAGYMVNKIQKEKKDKPESES